MTDEIQEVEERGEYTRADLEKIGQKWMDRIRACEKREDAWIKDAEAAEAAYLVDHTADAKVPRFNILHSNVETIVPSIYNSTPAPDIRPRHNTKDDLGKLVADVLERAITALIDDNRLDAEVEKEAQDAFMAGRGVVRLKFDADVSEPMLDPMTGMMVPPQITNERVIYEVVSWRDYREGPAKRWLDVPWVAFRHVLSEEALEKIEDPALAELQVDHETEAKEDADVSVWEIWCKDSGRVYFVVEENHKVLKIEDDPLGLTGFFPCAEPVQPITGTGKRTPVCPYSVYKSLAEELDEQTRRINKIITGLKVRGLIAAEASDVELLANAPDNSLTVAANLEGIVQAGGIDKAIMWWPIETAVMVLRELHAQREQTKQVIYEITGISDIIRGSSKSSETATAQQIKTEWGSLRIKKMQRLLERNVRDLFVMTAEIISRHFSYQTLQRMSGIQIPPEAQQLLSQPLDHYRIDVESDSTVRADTQKSRGEMAEFLNGTAQFFSTMAPIAQQAPASIGPLVEMYSSFARQFNLGKQAEDAIDQLSQMAAQVAQQPPPDPEAEARKEEMAMKRDQMMIDAQGAKEERQLKMAGLRLDNQIKQADLRLKRQRLQLDDAKAEFEAVATTVEMDMEADQKRAVKFGEQ